MNLDQPGLDPLETCRELRRAGFLGPVIGLAIDAGADLAARCAASGFTGYLVKPVTREALETVLGSLAAEPLVSTLAGDPKAAPLVARYVETLGERARSLAMAVEAGDVPGIHELARELRAAAGSYGFETITEEATRLQVLSADGGDAGLIRPAVYDLVHLCLAARAAPGDAG
jgi:CheY-like chemotaxis protein